VGISTHALTADDGGDAANPFERPRSHSSASQNLRERLKKFDAAAVAQAKQIAAEEVKKRLDEKKLQRLQSWIDSTTKVDLLDPQDVKGHLQRRAEQERQQQQPLDQTAISDAIRRQLLLSSQQRDAVEDDDESLRRSSGASAQRRESTAMMSENNDDDDALQ
jgi:hypothetical protein